MNWFTRLFQRKPAPPPAVPPSVDMYAKLLKYSAIKMRTEDPIVPPPKDPP